MSSFGLSSARAEASRRNGAKSKGPRTAEGKARSSQNAVKHGLRARKWVVLHGESETEFKRLETALLSELAPEGVLQSLLAQQVAAAAWRLGRANQIETQLFAANTVGTGARSLGRAVIRDCNNPRALDTLMRYRGGTQAEFYRALRTLKALQAEAAARGAAEHALRAQPNEPETRISAGDSRAEAWGPDLPSADTPTGGVTDLNPFPALAPTVPVPGLALAARPDEPERPRNPGDSGRASNPAAQSAAPGRASRPSPLSAPRKPAPCAMPIETERRGIPSESAARPAGASAKRRIMSLLVGTASRLPSAPRA